MNADEQLIWSIVNTLELALYSHYNADITDFCFCAGRNRVFTLSYNKLDRTVAFVRPTKTDPMFLLDQGVKLYGEPNLYFPDVTHRQAIERYIQSMSAFYDISIRFGVIKANWHKEGF